MGHSVEGHLKLNVADYDQLIRQLVPGYAAMRAAHMSLLKKLLPADRRCVVLDLGGGTGALAEAVAETLPLAEVEIWDIDRAMLGVARERCACDTGCRGAKKSGPSARPPRIYALQ